MTIIIPWNNDVLGLSFDLLFEFLQLLLCLELAITHCDKKMVKEYFLVRQPLVHLVASHKCKCMYNDYIKDSVLVA
jgi:hypothetical protein